MPAFTWTGAAARPRSATSPRSCACRSRGTAKRAGWGIGTAMDVLAIAVFVVATAIWIWRVRRWRSTMGFRLELLRVLRRGGVVAAAVFRLGLQGRGTRPRRSAPMTADSPDPARRHVRLSRDRARRGDLGLLPHRDRGGFPRRRAVDRAVGGRRRARRHADQRRHVRRHARPALSHRRELDLDLVRRLDRLGHLGDLRRAQAAPVRRADGRRLRRQALRQRRRAHAGGGAHHRHLHDLSDRAVPGDRRDRVGDLRHRAARGDDRRCWRAPASTPRSAACARARTSSSCRR